MEGSSKMNNGILKEGVLGVLNIQWHSLFKNYRKRVKSSPSLPEVSALKDIVAESK